MAEADGANRPATDDLEGLASAVHDGTIHILHQISEAVVHHAFQMGPEGGWRIRDEPVAAPGEPPTQVAALSARSDGSLVAVYGGPRHLHYRVRTPAGDWEPERTIEAPPGLILSGPQMVTGAGDAVHLAYTAGDSTGAGVWTRTIGPDGSLTPAVLVAEGVEAGEEAAGAVAPLVWLPESGEVVMVYRLADGLLHERRLRADGTLTAAAVVSDRPVVQNAVDSDQVGADVVGHDGMVHVIFIDEETRGLYHVTQCHAPGLGPPPCPWWRGSTGSGCGGASSGGRMGPWCMGLSMTRGRMGGRG